MASKRRTYSAHDDELRRAGITYVPVVWSAYGRPHPDAIRTIISISRNTARRRGNTNYRGLARGLSARIALEIWRRAANMVLRCWPTQVGGSRVCPGVSGSTVALAAAGAAVVGTS